MGNSTLLIPKTRDDEIHIKIMDCKANKIMSDKFSLFLSRFVFGEESEIKQVEQILSIDLSVYLRHPKNHFYDTDELEYKLYLAEKEKDAQKVNRIKLQIEEEIKNWELTYETNNEGWSTITEFRETTLNFIERINENPEFGRKIFVPVVLEYPWGDYFSKKEMKGEFDDRILDDLNILLIKLECIEKQGIKYVGFVGG